MTIVSAALTARHDAGELAVLNLSDGTFGRLADICLAAILSGAVLVAGARLAGDAPRRLASFRRAVAAAALLGLVGLIVASQARPILALMGQEPALAARSAPVIWTQALGLPFALVAVAAAVHLEAIGRAGLVTRWMVGANVLNLGLGATLIDGGFGLPGLGAWGAAIAGAIVRLSLAVVLVASLRAVEGPQLFASARAKVSPGRQLALASTAAGTSAAMHMLGIWLTIFAGWLGRLSLSAFASVWTLTLPGLVMAFGVADAIAIRAAADNSGNGDQMRGDLAVLFAALALLALVLAAFAGVIARAYAGEAALQGLIAGLLPMSALVLWLDGGSLGVFAALRARGDIAAPTAIQVGAMAATPVLGGWLAFRFEAGVTGLLCAIVITSAARLALMSARLARGCRLGLQPRPASE
jgi:MATE family multidrug resistance protein